MAPPAVPVRARSLPARAARKKRPALCARRRYARANAGARVRACLESRWQRLPPLTLASNSLTSGAAYRRTCCRIAKRVRAARTSGRRGKDARTRAPAHFTPGHERFPEFPRASRPQPRPSCAFRRSGARRGALLLGNVWPGRVFAAKWWSVRGLCGEDRFLVDNGFLLNVVFVAGLCGIV